MHCHRNSCVACRQRGSAEINDTSIVVANHRIVVFHIPWMGHREWIRVLVYIAYFDDADLLPLSWRPERWRVNYVDKTRQYDIS